jgi:hypothetical protein
MIDETDGRKIKESSKYLVEQDHEEDLKEEESDEEEDKLEENKEQQDLQVPPKTPSR